MYTRSGYPQRLKGLGVEAYAGLKRVSWLSQVVISGDVERRTAYRNAKPGSLFLLLLLLLYLFQFLLHHHLLLLFG
jgi:hypothetical protein